MILSRLVLLMALQMSSVHSFSPPIIIINNPQQQQQQQQQCTALQQSKQSTTPPSSSSTSSPSTLSTDMINIQIIESKEGMHEISFERNAKPMYDDILEAMPWFIRKLVQKNMNNAIAELCGDDDRVTERDMYDIVAKITPESNLQDSFDVLDRRKSPTAKEVTASDDVSVSEEGALNAAAAEFFKSEMEEDTVAAAAAASTAVPVPAFFQTENDDAPTATAVAVQKRNSNETERQPPKMPSWLSPSSSGSAAVIIAGTIAGRDIRFERNSKLMYDAILDGHSAFAFVRRAVKRNLDDAIADRMTMRNVDDDNDGDGDCTTAVVTEGDMYDVIEAASPRMLLKFNMAILDEHKSS
mmetsp:Transcript_14682/g.28029  ORF Transcript_14682/g.28029 Transcript_14682/m.28029 type:complete len:355 (-) Transcript_14682:56-1120(-)